MTNTSQIFDAFCVSHCCSCCCKSTRCCDKVCYTFRCAYLCLLSSNCDYLIVFALHTFWLFIFALAFAAKQRLPLSLIALLIRSGVVRAHLPKNLRPLYACVCVCVQVCLAIKHFECVRATLTALLPLACHYLLSMACEKVAKKGR